MAPLRLSIPWVMTILCVWIPGVHQERSPVIVRTHSGDIHGSLVEFDNTPVWQFLGVPFALPPIGKLRFVAPEPVPPWFPSVYNATAYKPGCMQDTDHQNDVNELESMTRIDYSEDCLYLNVFTPRINVTGPGPRLPVIVFIHGGEYAYGSAHGYPGYPLATKGVVVVTIQFRLGPFGFLSTVVPSVPGNAGMLDQIMALKWVQTNIAAFSGDPGKVTLAGHNSGATAACLHMFSPLSQGLFHQVTVVGGVAETPWAVKNWTVSSYYSSILMKFVGCKDDVVGNTPEELECLRDVNASQLLDISKKVFYIADTLPWFPVIGGPEHNQFLPEDLHTLSEKFNYSHNITVLVGLSKNEGQYLFEREVKGHQVYGENILKYLNATVHDSVIRYFLSQRIEFNMEAILAIAKYKYTYWPRLKEEEMFRQQLIQLYTDYNFVAPMTKMMQRQSQHSPSYMYLFDYHPDPNHPGANQGATLPYIFGLPFLKRDLKPSNTDSTIVEYEPSTEEGIVISTLPPKDTGYAKGTTHDMTNTTRIISTTSKPFSVKIGEGETTFTKNTKEEASKPSMSLPFSTVKPSLNNDSSTSLNTFSTSRELEKNVLNTTGTPNVGLSDKGHYSTKRTTNRTSTSTQRPTPTQSDIGDTLNSGGVQKRESANFKTVRNRRKIRDAKSQTAEQRMSSFMMELWTNFAKYGYPTLQTDDNSTWLPFCPYQWNYAWITEPDAIHMEYNYRHDKVALWNVYFPKLTIIPNDLPPDPFELEFDVYQMTMWVLIGLVLALLALIYYMTRASLKRRKQPSRFADQSRYLTLSMQRM